MRLSLPSGCTLRFQPRCVACAQPRQPTRLTTAACAGERTPARHVLHARQAAAPSIRGVERREARVACVSTACAALTPVPRRAAGLHAPACRYLFAVACVELALLSEAEQALATGPGDEVRCSQPALARECVSPPRAGARRLRGRVLAGPRVPQVEPQRARRDALSQGAGRGPLLLERLRGALRAGRREGSRRAAEQRKVRRPALRPCVRSD